MKEQKMGGTEEHRSRGKYKQENRGMKLKQQKIGGMVLWKNGRNEERDNGRMKEQTIGGMEEQRMEERESGKWEEWRNEIVEMGRNGGMEKMKNERTEG